uniref:Ovule protein n=1 Tax=Globodera pallida TaxID=36090 RepID=A0A183C6H7_GLOPA
MFGKNNTLKSKIMASKIKECLTITITPAISHLISSAQLVVVLDKWREVCLEHKILNIWAHRNLVMTIQFIMIIIWAHRNMAIHFIMLDLHKLFLVNRLPDKSCICETLMDAWLLYILFLHLISITILHLISITILQRNRAYIMILL